MTTAPIVELDLGTTLLERFTLKERLGSGSYGTVYLAFDALRSEDVALKIVDAGCGSELPALQLQHEIALHNKITDYRHVIKVHDIFFMEWEGSGLLLMSLEHANGGTFRNWLLENKENWDTRQTTGLDLFKQICLGVKAIHEAGLVHLDLKPENLVFVGQALKVSDLGAATAVRARKDGSGRAFCDGAIPELSTPLYMSPEHFSAAQPEDLDHRADVYSLGIILHEILDTECRTPFSGNPERLRYLHLNVPAPRLTRAGEVEARVAARCLEKDPVNRYQSISELIDDLEGRESTSMSDETAEGVSDHSQFSEKIHTAWDRASLYMSEEKLTEAHRLCKEILKESPEHEGAKHMLEELQARYEEAEHLYRIIEQGIDTRELSESVELLSEASRIYRDHPSGRLVRITLGEKGRKYQKASQEGLEALRSGSIRAALAFFEQARQLNPGNPFVGENVEALAEALQNITESRRHIDEAVQQGNDGKAMALARSLDKYVTEICTV